MSDWKNAVNTTSCAVDFSSLGSNKTSNTTEKTMKLSTFNCSEKLNTLDDGHNDTVTNDAYFYAYSYESGTYFDPTDYVEVRIVDGLNRYLSPVLFVTGVVGSLMTFLIMHKKAKMHSTYLYLTVLSIVDIVVVCVSQGQVFLAIASDGTFDLPPILHCSGFLLLINVPTNISVYLVVCVAIDRFISVYFPFVAKFICTFHRAVIVCSGIIIFQFLVHMHFVWTNKLDFVVSTIGNSTIEYSCSTPKEYRYFINYIWPWIDLINFFFLPSVTLIVLSALIVYKITKQRRQVAPASATNGTSTTNQSQLTVSLVAICVAMIICNCPVVVFSFIEPHVEISTMLTFVRFALAHTVCDYLMNMNNCVNFFLYIITSKRFRNEFVEMLKSIKSKICALAETSNTGSTATHSTRTT